MNNLRFNTAVLMAKAMIKLMRLLHKNATNLPGEAALKICPDLLQYFTMPENVIVVTGTNGKTTVCNLIGEALVKNGFDIITNSFGGNVDTGIASILIDNCKLNGSFLKDTLLLEMDERSAVKVLPKLNPDYLVCTNLQRDSMKRNAHVEFIFNILNENLPSKTKLILNADDLVSNRLGKDNKRAYFGVDKLEGEIPTTNNIIFDLSNCPSCGTKLDYSFRHYNHIGRAVCPECGLSSPIPNYVTESVNGENINVLHDGNNECYHVQNNRITDIYNFTATITFLREFGLTYEQVKNTFENMKIVKSRYDSFEVCGKKVYVTLAKGQNPVACSCAMDFVQRLPGKKAVIMILEDLYDAKKTSENIAWLYETDFEFLCGDDVKQVIVGGKRFDDYVVRLMIAGMYKDRIFGCYKETETVSMLNIDDVDNIIILYDLFNVTSLNSIKQQLMALSTEEKDIHFQEGKYAASN